jgi:hypothetical protein
VLLQVLPFDLPPIGQLKDMGTDTVGQPPSAEIGVLNMPSLQAKKLRKPSQEKVLLEL